MTQSYMPILKWKRGEQLALSNLASADKTQTYPMIELLDLPDWDQPMDGQGHGPFHAIVQQFVKSWGTADPVAVDMEDVDTNATHPVEVLFAEARSMGLRLVPVTSPSPSAGYQSAVARIVQQDGRGVVLRLEQDELFDAAMAASTQQALATLGLAAGNVDFVCDLGYIGPSASPMLPTAVRGVFSQVPTLAAWRRLIVTASNFPPDLQAIQRLGRIPRTEWALWRALQSSSRVPIFGDYAVAHPIYTAVPFAGAANIRYTVADEWVIHRGRKVTGPGGYGQYVTLSQQLVASSDFCGATFSWGDSQIDACARGVISTGNMITWRAIGTNHHIVYVLRQLAAMHANPGRGSPAAGPIDRGGP